MGFLRFNTVVPWVVGIVRNFVVIVVAQRVLLNGHHDHYHLPSYL